MLQMLIAEDHAIVRKGLEQIIKDEYTDSNIEFATNGDEAYSMVNGTPYDLVVLDINLPGTNSVGLFQQLLTLQPDLKILICSKSPEKIFAFRYLRLGASGYVEQSVPDDVLRDAVKGVLAGKKYCSNAVTDQIAERFSGRIPTNPFDLLSDKEFEVGLHLIKGLQINEIAEVLDVHQSTIAARKVRILKKAGVTNIVELFNLARQHKIID